MNDQPLALSPAIPTVALVSTLQSSKAPNLCLIANIL
jgi:hypothetical protein